MLKVGLPLLPKHRDRWNRKRVRNSPKGRKTARTCWERYCEKRAENPAIAERYKQVQRDWWHRNKHRYKRQYKKKEQS